jgi:hypothetical protein
VPRGSCCPRRERSKLLQRGGSFDAWTFSAFRWSRQCGFDPRRCVLLECTFYPRRSHGLP